MACPFFFPVEPFRDGVWLKPPRLPLGDPCRGECLADPNETAIPALEDLRQYCNLGYARGRCSRFPMAAEADAVRFSIVHDRDGAISLLFILERDYGPLRHEPLVYEIATRSFTSMPFPSCIAAQANRFVESYLKRRVPA